MTSESSTMADNQNKPRKARSKNFSDAENTVLVSFVLTYYECLFEFDSLPGLGKKRCQEKWEELTRRISA